jgi:SNF2 family DNA or RNA helicase
MFCRVGGGQIRLVVDGGVVASSEARRHGVPPWLSALLQSEPIRPPPVQAPRAYVGCLHSYQEDALGFAEHRKRTMLALDCGLGKTHIGIAYMLLHLPAMVVCPASLKENWLEHILSYAPSAIDQITIVSYNKMTALPGIQCVVADEAHYLKHETSQRSKLFADLLTHCPRALLMTGTPAQRNTDLFHLLKLLDPIHFRHFYHYERTKLPDQLYFAERYCKPQPVWIGGTRHGFKFTTNRNSEELALICEHYMLRMKKEDVVQLPHLTREGVLVGKTTDPKYFKDKWDEIETIRETKGSRLADVEMLALCRETSHLKMPYVGPYLSEWISKHPSEKVIVFYHHQDIGNQIVGQLPLGVGHIRIDGKTTMKKRVKLLQTFKEDPGCVAGVLSMCATSTGLNLQFCTKIIFVELTFLSVHHTQAEARIHRIGQQHAVSVDYLILDGTTDNLLWRALLAKRHTEKVLFDSSIVPVHKMDSEDEIEPL